MKKICFQRAGILVSKIVVPHNSTGVSEIIETAVSYPFEFTAMCVHIKSTHSDGPHSNQSPKTKSNWTETGGTRTVSSSVSSSFAQR